MRDQDWSDGDWDDGDWDGDGWDGEGEWDEEVGGNEDDDLQADTIVCPNCGGAVYEDAPQCPACGEWITTRRRPMAGWPWWFTVGGVVGIVAVIVALVLAGR